MADKPSRSLVLYGDGLACSVGPGQAHLDHFASRACCGFLALPNPPSSENEDDRVIREFANLLDSSEAYDTWLATTFNKDGSQENSAFSTIPDRFMGMKAAVVTENSRLQSFGDKLGLSVIHWNELFDKSLSLDEIPSLATELLKLLGFESTKVLNTSSFDAIFLHVEANKKMSDLGEREFLNHMVGNVLDIAVSEKDIGSRLHMSVVTSYGSKFKNDPLEFSFSADNSMKNIGLSLPFPRQSYMMKGGKPRENIRQHSPMLLAQYQDAVTRRDMVESFSFRDFLENGGNLVIPADRFLHEVAFKLWKAPKYGA